MSWPAREPLGLSRNKRIRHRRDFFRLRQEGKRTTGDCLVANWRPLPADATSRLGIVTSSKLGGAVLRSRARRLLREAFRHHQADFAQPLELVLVARNSIVGKRYDDVRQDLLNTLRKARLLK
jgi:ribonuclease P protein component